MQQGKQEEEGTKSRRMVQIIINVDEPKTFPMDVSLSDKVGDVMIRIPSPCSPHPRLGTSLPPEPCDQLPAPTGPFLILDGWNLSLCRDQEVHRLIDELRLRCVARHLLLHGLLVLQRKRRVNNFVRNLRLMDFNGFSAQLELQELSPACPRALEGHRSGPRQVVLESLALDVALSDKVSDVVKKLPNGACCSKRDVYVTWRGKSAEKK